MDVKLNPGEWVLFVDASLLAINKPAGLPTLPDGYDPAAPHMRSVLEPIYGRLWIVHRLDRDTSGVLLLARTAEAHRALNAQFDARQIEKVYHALVMGNPPWQETTANLPLRANAGHRHRTAVDHQRGKPSVTRLRVIVRFGEFTLVEAIPETGRTHQIRAHLSALGFPVAGDSLYGGGVEGRLPLTRLWLHARSLTLAHPQTGETLRLEAPYPGDLTQVLTQLRGDRPPPAPIG